MSEAMRHIVRHTKSKQLKNYLDFYVETDIKHKTITIEKNRKTIRLNLFQAKFLSKLLNHQIRLLSDK